MRNNDDRAVTSMMDRPAVSYPRPHVPTLRGSLSLRVLAALAAGLLLYLGHAAFVPVALAGLLALILMGPVEALHRLGLPRGLCAIVVLAFLGTLVGTAINLLWTPAQNWWASAPTTLRTIEHKVRPLSQFMSRVEALTARADQLAETGSHAESALPPVVTPREESAATGRPPLAVAILDQTRTVVMSLVTVIMLLLFLLAGGPPMLARMSAALASDLQSTHSLLVITAVRTELSRYYGGLALINLGLGLATAGVMSLLEMPNPLLWGAVAGVLNFIPYVGSATTLVMLSVVAFVTFPNAGRVALVAASYLGLATIEGQLVQPLVIGRRLELNPMIVFLALWFGGWFWGVAGIVMAIPTLVAFKVVSEHSLHGSPMAEFLSPGDGHLRRIPAAAAAIAARSALRTQPATPAVAARKGDAEGRAGAGRGVDLESGVQ
jgi:predicted PurR-regulated permease PerM